MLEITVGKTKKQLPNSWGELTQEQFVYLTGLMLECNRGAISPGNLRAIFACHLLGFSDRTVGKLAKHDKFNENIYRLSVDLNFMFKFEYEDHKKLAKFPLETRKALKRIDPNDLGDSQHVRLARKMKKSLIPDNIFAKQLIPEITKRRVKLLGYTFMVESDILTTNLTAEQFADALTVYQQLLNDKKGDESLVNKLIAVLYCNPYTTSDAIKLSNNLSWVNPAIKQAVVYNFMAIQAFLFTSTKYKVLFNSTNSKKKTKNPTGFESSIFSLVRKGYGDINTMSNTNLVKFFETMYNDLVSTIGSLKQQGVELTKISEQTGLSIAVINSLS